VQSGEHVVPQMPVVEIVDLSRVELHASISPGDSLDVRDGQTARLTVEGAPDAVIATVTRINPSAQLGSRDVPVYLTLPADAPGLRQGLFAQGMLETGEKRVLAVPLNAVRNDKPLPYIQLVKDNRGQLIAVQMGARGIVQAAAANAAVTPETWVAVHPLEQSAATASQGSAQSAIQPGDTVLRNTAGALIEGAAVKLPQPE
jgi:hypothetical protein